MNQLTEAMVTIFVAIIGVAILAVIVSNKSNTAGVLQAFGSMFSNSLATATAPVTGANVNINTSYPGSPGSNVFAGLYQAGGFT